MYNKYFTMKRSELKEAIKAEIKSVLSEVKFVKFKGDSDDMKMEVEAEREMNTPDGELKVYTVRTDDGLQSYDETQVELVGVNRYDINDPNSPLGRLNDEYGSSGLKGIVDEYFLSVPLMIFIFAFLLKTILFLNLSSIILIFSNAIVPDTAAVALDFSTEELAAPPMWKVLIVNCVPGSPIDCAAIIPTASPTLTGVPLARSLP